MIKTKKIVIILLLVIGIEIIMPTLSSQAGFLDAIVEWSAEKVFSAMSELLVELGDKIIEALQHIFVTPYGLRTNWEHYGIQYSPGIIFSGTVPGLDVNFINPREDKEIPNSNVLAYVQAKKDKGEKINEAVAIGTWNGKEVKLSVEGFAEDGLQVGTNQYFVLYTDTYTIKKTATSDIIQDDKLDVLVKVLLNDVNIDEIYENIKFERDIEAILTYIGFSTKEFEIGDTEINGTSYKLYYKADGNKNVELKSEYGEETYTIAKYDVESGQKFEDNTIFYKNEDLIQLVKENIGKIVLENSEQIDAKEIETVREEIKDALNEEIGIWKVYESSAKLLKESISKWYKVMMEVALVGLLSVLVYVSIRMIITSSIESKAKYKKMLGDWVAAVCIIFLLHYLMALTFTCTQAINDIFNAKIIGKNGEDVLMSGIRDEIEGLNLSWHGFATNLMYLILVILTVMFTYEYLKRFVYIAFLTMIAPIIALTYPLDKIKDGSAQAYGMWIREFLFSVLIQPVHLVVYYVILGMSEGLITKGNPEYNPIYAIVAIGFMLPAEKFIRKMFGFDKAEANSKIGSALGGAAVMNWMNKIKAGGKGGQKGGKTEQAGNKTRMANSGTDSYEALRGGAQARGNASQPGGRNTKATLKNGATTKMRKI